ncbi:MAG: hypothetical protein V1659_02000 [Candidatus Woesearchaeota archaeon]
MGIGEYMTRMGDYMNRIRPFFRPVSILAGTLVAVAAGSLCLSHRTAEVNAKNILCSRLNSELSENTYVSEIWECHLAGTIDPDSVTSGYDAVLPGMEELAEKAKERMRLAAMRRDALEDSLRDAGCSD